MSKRKIIAFWACLTVAALSTGYIVYYYVTKSQNEQVYQNLQSTAESAAEDSTPPEEADTPDIPIDFTALQAVNPDVYAWIRIPDAGVDYPVLQSQTDNSYYLNYTIDGTKGYPGAIYSELYNSKDFSDFNTVLYGHNMRDGSMFGTLRKYRDADFLKEHRDIFIYTPTEIRHYQVFAAVVFDDRRLTVAFHNDSEDDRKAFLNAIVEDKNSGSQILDDLSIDTDSKILTLSTCIGGEPNNRYLVEAVYVGDQ